jgi:ring-1,2-phenylacetyl-CoA epoxidase subunit PaaE
MNTYSLKVIDIKTETEDTVTLCFKQPSLRKIKYLPGQYLTLIFRINGRRYIRPYSFSSCPMVDEYLEITVKRIFNGLVSNYINDEVKIGDIIEVMQPMGDFTYISDDFTKKIYLWGVGSGITPLISLAKHILYHEADKKVVLIYGNKNHESTIFLKAIKNLKKEFISRFAVLHFHTKLVIDGSTSPMIIQGRIDHDKALTILNADKELHLSKHYICGPLGLKESVRQALRKSSVVMDYVFSEDFELVKNPADFEEIHTQLVKLKYIDQIIELEVVKGRSILEAALDADIELPYSCQTGNCSTCSAIVRSGEVKMIGLSKERADLKEDEYLLCCSHPITSNVYIEI